jgi:carboxyl-terminal processing protease
VSKKIKNFVKNNSKALIIFSVSFGMAFVFLFGLYVGNGKIALGDSLKMASTATDSNLPADLNYDSVEALYDTLRKNYDGELKEEELIDGIKKGLVDASGDQYTEYLNSKEAEEFESSLNGSFSGIGAELGEENDTIVIVAPISGFPAEKAGIRAKDVLVKINDESALDMSVSDAVTKIRGPEGSKVKLKVVRDGKEELDFEITREQITIPSVEYEITEDNIGYLKISRFSDDTNELAQKAAQEFKNKKVKGVVLDLRNNPGGLLDSSVDISSLWLEKNKIVLEEKRGGETIKTYKSKGNDILGGIPTVVLINEGSASASEITAGALKDNGVADLVGEKSFGKGSVQQVTPLSTGGVLKVTIAKWFTPNGKNINEEGIEPDKKVEITEEDLKNDKDPQKDAAIEILNN